MASKNIKGNTRGSNITGFNVSGKSVQYHTTEFNVQKLPPLIITGGTITESGGVRYHSFTSSDSFQISGGSLSPFNVKVLVVAGGGGGGGSYGGGGGGGGVVQSTAYPVTRGTYTVTIGAGGAGGNQAGGSVYPPSYGKVGGVSEFGPNLVSHPSPTWIRSNGGGGASGIPYGAADNTTAANGGAVSPAQPLLGQPGYPVVSATGYGGNPGGTAIGSSPYYGRGGGGGSAGAGNGGTNTAGGNGGLALGPSTWSWIPPSFGHNGYFAGGGGGGTYGGGTSGYGNGGSGNSGGAGPAGTPGTNSSPGDGISGLNNTGGGGGGGCVNTPGGYATMKGGNGGSGYILVSYPTLILV